MSVLEGALTRKDHGYIVLVAAVNDIPVAKCTSGLDNGRHAFADADLQTVPEGEEGVGNHGGADETALLRGGRFIRLGTAARAFFRAEFLVEFVVRRLPFLPCNPVGEFFVGFVAGDFRHAHAILFAGADADRGTILDVEDGVGRDARFDEPAEQQVIELSRGGLTVYAVHRAIFFAEALRREEIGGGPGFGHERPLGDKAAINERLEIDKARCGKIGKPRHVADSHDAQIFLFRENIHHAGREFRSDHDLGIVFRDETRRFDVAFAVERDAPAEGGQPVGFVCPVIGIREGVSPSNAARVVVLDDDGARLLMEIAQDVERVVGIRQVDFAGVFAALQQFGFAGEGLSGLDALDIAEDEIAVDELVDGGFLTGIFPVAKPFGHAVNQPMHLFVDEGLGFGTVDKADFHSRREMVIHDGFVSLLEIVHRLRAFTGLKVRKW